MPEPNVENRTLFHGDNLDFLRGINGGTVNLIATDPPFNKSKDFHATPDSLAKGASFVDRWSWDRDVHSEWVDAIQDDWPAAWTAIDSARKVAGDDMGAFLCWLGVRLMEMHRVLADDGSIYLHIDHTAHAYVKTLMDAIFGLKNFRNAIVWRSTSAHSDSRRFGANTETILFYTKGDQWVWNPLHEPYDQKYKARFRFKDPDGRRWSDYDLTAKGLSGGGYRYQYKGITELWRVPLETMKRLDAEGRLHFTSRGGIRRKRYLDEMQGRPIQQLWADIDSINSQAKERTGYPTQKPIALYGRMIEASSNEGDLVLDPFCGCATTPIAAERLGRQWVGIDIWDSAYKMVLDRLQSEQLAVPTAQAEEFPALLTFGEVRYETTPPVRTDDAKTAAPTLVLKVQVPEPSGPKMTNADMKAFLIQKEGIVCRGCLRKFDDERYLQLDHNAPRSQGGLHHISNRLLLCGPCNLAKSNTLTLEGLRRLNRQNGWMAKG